MVAVDDVEVNVFQRCHHRTDARVGLLTLLENEDELTCQTVAQVVDDADARQQNGHVTVVSAALCHSGVLRQERLRFTFSVQCTLLDGQTVDISPQADRLASPFRVEDGIEPRTAWYIVNLKAADLGKLCFQILGSFHLLASNLWIKMQMPAHLSSIAIILADFRK